MVGTQITGRFKMEGSKLKFLIISVLLACLVACISSKDYSNSSEAKRVMDKCYELSKPAFVFESRCADIDGSDNSTVCLGIQVAGEGGFPINIETYLSNNKAIDAQLFDRLAFEKQRHILFHTEEGTRITLARLVHHGWGTMGQYWIIRGDLIYKGRKYEVELPSLDLIHKKPLWFDARANKMPNQESFQYLQSCK